MPKYIAICWRNDGGWHEKYNMAPMFIFEADGDDVAKRLIVTYIEKHQDSGEDFWLRTLMRIDGPIVVKEVPVANHEKYRDDKNFIPVLLTPKVDAMLEKVGIEELEIGEDLLKKLS